MWCVPELNAEYIERMEEVLEIYERPYNAQEPVVCLDEKPVVLHDQVRAGKQARPGTLAKRDYEYKRQGGANVFCAVEAKAGRHFTHPTPNRKAPEFAKMIQRLANSYPLARTIHLVLDNLNTHCRKSLDGYFGVEHAKAMWERFTVHYTPKHASWLNQAEVEISLFSRPCLGKRRIPNLATLRSQTKAWNQRINRHRTILEWHFSRPNAQRCFHYQTNLFVRSQH
jgi:DDE superfamily endonuclease